MMANEGQFKHGASEMMQEVRALAPKSEDLRLMPGSPVVEKKNGLPLVAL